MALAFVDLEKAFGIVPRKMAMATLRWMGAPDSKGVCPREMFMHIEMAGRNIKVSSYIFSTTRPHVLNILCSFQVKYSAHESPIGK